MGVKIRKLRGKWYLVIDHRGKRKTRVIGTDRKIAEKVRRKVEAKLALGDVGILSENQPCETSGSESSKSKVPLFSDYAATWLSDAEAELKRSTVRSYEQLLRLHVIPQFGSKQLSEISRKDVKTFVRSLAGQTRTIDQATGPRFSRNTLRLILCALRTVLSAAVEDGLLESNPASKVGKFAKREPREQEAAAMTRAEADSFLFAIREVCPDWYPFFLTALRAGLRRGELIALKFGDIHFGASESDSSRYILVQRNYSFGAFTTPKNKKSRRVDMSRQLRATLVELRDQRLLQTYLRGKTSISDELVFPSQARTPIKPDNIAVRYMQPALEKAGLHHFRFHDLRHTFGSLLIQGGASLAYVKEQMGHSSIQVTVDIYGHLIPGADISCVDQLDSPTQESANYPQTLSGGSRRENAQVIEKTWLPPRDSNPDMLIQSQLSYH